MRLAWAAEHDATLSGWAGELKRLAGRRPSAASPSTLRSFTGHTGESAVCGPGVDGSPFVYIREATLGTGMYLDPAEAEPGAAVQAVFDVLGLDRRDVEPDIPPSLLAERITAYRAVHPGQDAMRLLAFNPGSGELLARALTTSVLAPAAEDDDELAPPPARLEIAAYSRRPFFTDPVPALTDLQRRSRHSRCGERAPTSSRRSD